MMYPAIAAAVKGAADGEHQVVTFAVLGHKADLGFLSLGPDQNWFTTPFDDRKEMMYEHGASGRKFSGRILQLVTGSTGLDEYEWGVTLFGQRPDDLKDTVYTMRYDRASAIYAEFGPFYTGVIGDVDDVLAQVGIS